MHNFLLWLWWLGSRASPLPVLVLGAAAMFNVQLFRDIHDVDIFWQVKLGEITLKEGLPKHEPFLINQQHEPLATIAWLGQAVYAAVKMLGGWTLLRFVDAAIWFGGFVLVARQAARRAGNDWPALIGLGIGWYAAIPHASLRPQSWAVLGFGLLMLLVRSKLPNNRKIILGTALLILWQNMHPSVVLGIGYLAVFAFVSLIRREPTRVANCVLFGISIVSTVCTPQGVGIFAISKYNEEISKKRGITEWLPMYPNGDGYLNAMDYGRDNAWIAIWLLLNVLVFVVLARFVTGRWRIRLDDTLVVFGLMALSISMHRFILFWAVAAIPLIAEALTVPSLNGERCRWRTPVALIAFLIAVVPPMTVRKNIWHDYFPSEAVDRLYDSGFQGNIYSNYFWGGVLVEKNYPHWHVSHDGRYYLFRPEDWDLYNAAAQGLVPTDNLVEQFQVQAFFLRKNRGGDYPNDVGLIQQLRARWPIWYEDDLCAVFLVPKK